MAVMAPREESWTDEPKLREEFGEMRAEIRGLEKKFDARFDAVDAKFEAADAKFDGMIRAMQIGFGVIGTVLTVITGMLAGLITLIATQL